jgi:5-methylcytosine-specific restriction protein A
MHKRRNFTKQTQREAYERSQGICECHRLAARGIPGFAIEGCGVRLSAGNTFYEHIQCDNLSGLNDLDNCAALVKTCWRLKTDTYDLPTIAKSNRVQDGARGIQSSQFRPLPGTKASGIKLGFGKPPTWRDSGRPLHERRKG